MAKRRSKRSGSYGTRGPAQDSNTKRGGARKSKSVRSTKKRNTFTRKQKKSRKRESFISTLNQMGGFIRDGSTQFFNMVTGV